MTPCLQPDEIIDLVDGVLDPARATHVESCGSCRGAAAEVRAALAEVATATMPEPSPYFWPAVNRRVHAAIAAAPAARDGWRAWLAWDTLVPVAGMAAVLMALGTTIARPPTDFIAAPALAGAASPGAADVAGDPADDALSLVVELAETLPDTGVDSLDLAPLPDLGDVAAAALTDDELHALEVILRAAVDRPKS